MCDYAPCKDVMPGATSFSERKGQPPYVEAYADEAGQKKLLGYVMLSTDITDIPAYSGKPVVTLIGMDTAGKFSGVKILKHSEPILLLGIPESALIKFNNQYLGKFVGDNIEIGKSRPEENLIGLDAITGATVTVIAQNQVMMLSGGEVAKQVGILKPVVRPQAKFRRPPPRPAGPSWSRTAACSASPSSPKRSASRTTAGPTWTCGSATSTSPPSARPSSARTATPA
jgi:NosR/NirI family nitrous oxide reductase transcriptional regulator